VAWREDVRKTPTSQQVRSILGKVMRTGVSEWWLGYWQNRKRQNEIMFVPRTGDPFEGVG
jgi:hypothetical protein